MKTLLLTLFILFNITACDKSSDNILEPTPETSGVNKDDNQSIEEDILVIPEKSIDEENTIEPELPSDEEIITTPPPVVNMPPEIVPDDNSEE
jgi:hypothetical protein